MPDNVLDSVINNEVSADQSPPQNNDSKATSVTLQTTNKRRFTWIRRLGAGIRLDIRARAPWYLSDWTDAWNCRVVPATALIFFAKYVSQL